MAVAPLPETDGGGPITPERGRGLSREWRSFWSNPLAIAGISLLGFLILLSFIGPIVYHTNPESTNLLDTFAAPTAAHLLGTDALGRDELARLMLGGQLSLEVGFAAGILSVILGTLYGLVAGLAGGWLDALLMRIVDILFALPGLYILLLVDSIFSPSAILLVVVISVLSWLGTARLVRAEVLTLKQREFVHAARSLGSGNWRLMMRHLLPNVMGVVMVTATFSVGSAILTVAGLSFLGLGLPPPTPNWGGMLADGTNYIFQNAWWLIYPPGLAIVAAELGVNFLGDALRASFDPRLREGRA
ncbi:MAG: ABC transporter permease [Sulfobacillus sp.]